jgi:hypothetical protein
MCGNRRTFLMWRQSRQMQQYFRPTQLDAGNCDVFATAPNPGFPLGSHIRLCFQHFGAVFNVALALPIAKRHACYAKYA